MGRPITPQDLWTLKRVGQPEHVPGTTTAVVPVVHYDDEDSALVMSRRKSRASTGSNPGLKNEAIARMLQKQSPVPPKSQDGPLDFSSPSK